MAKKTDDEEQKNVVPITGKTSATPFDDDDAGDVNEPAVTRLVPLTKPEIAERALDLAKAVDALDRFEEECDEAKGRMKTKRKAIQAEIRRLKNAVLTGQEEQKAQQELFE